MKFTDQSNQVESFFKFFKGYQLSIDDIFSSFKGNNKYKKMSKSEIRKCIITLIKQKKIEKADRTHWQMIKNELVYVCTKCNEFSLSRNKLYNHFLDKHVKTFVMGKLIKCKLMLREMK